MPAHFCLTVRYLQPYSHGRGGDGDPEWPPSPLRMFQSLVAAAAARWNERMRLEYAAPALRWLERQPSPVIVAAAGAPSDVKYRLYVPDNVADKVAASWSSGREASIADYRIEKDVRPTLLRGDAVHYLFPLSESDAEFEKHRNTLIDAALSVTHLGWGVDMVAGSATVVSDDEVADLPGEWWRPADDSSAAGLRVPKEGTLDDLSSKHTASLNRLSADGFRPVPPLCVFRVVGYRRATDTAARPWAAFRIVSIDPDGSNPSFDTARRCRDVAAWVRNATGAICQEWPDVASFVHGHDATDTTRPLKTDERFMYLPLPTINSKLDRVESIRRVLVVAPPGLQDRIDWVRRRLPGQELAFNGQAKGMLTDLKPDWVLGRYTGESLTWSTVTPVILPGYDDPDHLRRRLRNNRDAEVQHRLLAQLNGRIEGLLRKALRHAGLATEVVAAAALEWRQGGFRAGVDLAHRYTRPENLEAFSAYHVRVRFSHPVRGPLAVGAGRYRGLGVFAIEEAAGGRRSG